MSIFRVQKSQNYSVINNTMILDKRLSWKAKGILGYFLARPDDWQFYMTEIVNHSKDGKDSLRKGIEELEQCGYIKRTKKMDKGKFKGYEYDVFEVPQTENRVGKSAAESTTSENPTLLSTDILQITKHTKRNSESDVMKIAEMLYDIYPVKKGKALSNIAKKTIAKHGYDQLKDCIELYKQDIRRKGTDERYVKGFGAFFGREGTTYLDFLNEKSENKEIKPLKVINMGEQ